VKVTYSRRALGDIDAIGEFLNTKNPAAATKVVVSIRSAIRMISQQPFAGRLQDTGARRFVAMPYGYLIYYGVDTRGIEIITVQHPARDRVFIDA